MDTMQREITEEISRDGANGFVSRKLGIEIFDAINLTLRHYRDFLSVITSPKDYISVDSAFYSEISSRLIEDIIEEMKDKRRVLTEGLLRIVDVEELRSGKIIPAWSTGEILSHFYGFNMPNPNNVRSIPLKGDFCLHRDYREKFEYVK